MWELDHKESWAQRNWCFWTAVLEKPLENPLDFKEIQPVHPKGNQSWIFTERTDVEAETPIVWPPDVKNWLIGKDPDAGKDWGQEKGTKEDEIVRWHHRLNEREFEHAPEVGDGQGGLACYSPWDHRVGHDWVIELNWSNTTRPFRYDLNQILYDYTVEMTNKFKGLDLIECLENYGWRFTTLYRRRWSKLSPIKDFCLYVHQWYWPVVFFFL